MNTIIAFVLAASPTERAPPFEVADVQVETGPNSSHVLAYDRDGEVAAEIILWPDASGRIRLDANFADGLYMTAVVGDDGVVLDSDNAAEVAARAEAINDFLAGTDPQEQWVPCAIGVVGTVLGAAAANPWAIVTSFAAACTCLPLLVEEWEDYSCPGFG